jgi:hypothetical protein
VGAQIQSVKDAVDAELEAARVSFHELLVAMSPDELRKPSNGTKWNNEELLFHMLFGYIILWSLIWLVKLFGRLPMSINVLFAALLNFMTGPFNLMNYLGSRLGARIYDHRRMGAKFDRVTASLQRRMAGESEQSLGRQMSFPVKWDPFFKRQMTLADVYHYPKQHFDFHRRQLSAG